LRDSSQSLASAWYFANSGNRTHPVGLLKGNAFRLYDMAGNVFEWTGDWKGYYCAGAVVNSIGAPYPNESGERVIKGGAFNFGFGNLRPSARKYSYETPQSTRAEYIGFRCARGIIVNPSPVTTDTFTVRTNPCNSLYASLKTVTGATRVRLVFINVTKTLRTLCLVDYETGYPVVREFRDMTGIYVPAISPDGRFVAFSTRNDGQTGRAIHRHRIYPASGQGYTGRQGP
jgi:hypothetical protein